MGISLSDVTLLNATRVVAASSPDAIRACVASLAAEAFDAGHSRAAQVLAHAAALLSQSDLWNRPKAE